MGDGGSGARTKNAFRFSNLFLKAQSGLLPKLEESDSFFRGAKMHQHHLMPVGEQGKHVIREQSLSIA